MKKLWLLIPLILFSCTKDTKIDGSSNVEDSISILGEPIIPEYDSVAFKDSLIRNAAVTKKVNKEGVMREDKGEQIVRVVDASALPFTIGEKFDEGHTELVIKINDFDGEKISAFVTPEEKDMNIRINEIHLSNGKQDGPFGRELKNYTVNNAKDVVLIIGKSNMASGKSSGSFKVDVQ